MKKKTAVSADDTKTNVEALAALMPSDVAGILDAAADAIVKYDAGILGRNQAAAESALSRYDAAIWKLNGGKFFGCRADATAAGAVIDQYCRAEPGQAPMWGQLGEFLITVSGVRCVVTSNNRFHGTTSLEFHAIDTDKPFISQTGYRSNFVTPLGGQTVEEVAVAAFDGFVRTDLSLIKPEHRPLHLERSPFLWLESLPAASDLTYQEAEGQMAFGF